MRLITSTFLILCSYAVETKRTRQIWQKSPVTWTFSDPHQLVHSEITRDLMRSLVNTSFTLWQNALQDMLTVVEATSLPADIDIQFARKDHGDREPLDGPGGMVAHSGLPPRGYLHLDADEQWSFDGERGVDLRYVVLHETGHLLGLRHLWAKEAIMNPYYRRLKKGMTLSRADIRAIRKLYRISLLVRDPVGLEAMGYCSRNPTRYLAGAF